MLLGHRDIRKQRKTAPPPGFTKIPWPAPSAGLEFAADRCREKRCIACSEDAAAFYVSKFGVDAVRRSTHVDLSVDKRVQPEREAPTQRPDHYHAHSDPYQTSFMVPSMRSRPSTVKRPGTGYNNKYAIVTSWQVPSMLKERDKMTGTLQRPKSVAGYKGASLNTESMESERTRRGRLMIHSKPGDNDPMNTIITPSMRMGDEQGRWNTPPKPKQQSPAIQESKHDTTDSPQPTGGRFVYHAQKDPWLRAKNRPVTGSKPGQQLYGRPMPDEMLRSIDPLRPPLRPSSAISHKYVDMKRSSRDPRRDDFKNVSTSSRNPDGTLTRVALKRIYGF